jgi:hypothetical protein
MKTITEYRPLVWRDLAELRDRAEQRRARRETIVLRAVLLVAGPVLAALCVACATWGGVQTFTWLCRLVQP